MHDFSCANPDDINYEAHQAEQNKAKKMAICMIKASKMPLEDIANHIELSLDTIKELASQSMQST